MGGDLVQLPRLKPKGRIRSVLRGLTGSDAGSGLIVGRGLAATRHRPGQNNRSSGFPGLSYRSRVYGVATEGPVMRKTKHIAVLTGCLALAGCGEKELSSCIASTEPIILLRQMTLTSKAREAFDKCLNERQMGRDYCKALWLGADTAAGDCMAQQGYTFTSTDSGFGFCGFSNYEDPKCYQSKWSLMLPAAIRKRFWSPYNPP
jgi:hypothetical protein